MLTKRRSENVSDNKSKEEAVMYVVVPVYDKVPTFDDPIEREFLKFEGKTEEKRKTRVSTIMTVTAKN